MRPGVALAALLAPALAAADEGLWTFDRFPSAQVQQRYGFAPDAQPVSSREHGAPHPLAVDERAVGAAKIFHLEFTRRLDRQAAVDP